MAAVTSPHVPKRAAFGLGLDLGFELPGLPERLPPAGAPTIRVRAAATKQLLEEWSGAAGEPLWQTIFGDGATYRLLPGQDGDHLIEYAGQAAAFHLSPDGLLLSCADPLSQPASWQRTLTDSVLWTVALLHHSFMLHASAVETPSGAVAILGPEGSGKSSLAARLSLDGWPLVSDDILALERRGDRIVAHPGPNLMNLSLGLHAQLAAASLGEVLATFGGPDNAEAWILVDRYSRGELPLAAVVLLDRAAGRPTRATRVAATPLHVTPHTLTFEAMPGASRRRFESVSDLVELVPVLRIEADVGVPPADLAATVRSALAEYA